MQLEKYADENRKFPKYIIWDSSQTLLHYLTDYKALGHIISPKSDFP